MWFHEMQTISSCHQSLSLSLQDWNQKCWTPERSMLLLSLLSGFSVFSFLFHLLQTCSPFSNNHFKCSVWPSLLKVTELSSTCLFVVVAFVFGHKYCWTFFELTPTYHSSQRFGHEQLKWTTLKTKIEEAQLYLNTTFLGNTAFKLYDLVKCFAFPEASNNSLLELCEKK